MVITATPLASDKTLQSGINLDQPGTGAGVSRRISLSNASINGTGLSVVDLTGEWGTIEFCVSNSFIDYLGK